MINNFAIQGKRPADSIPTWKRIQQSAQRTEAKRRLNLSNLPDMKYKRDSELAQAQGIVKDGIETESVVIEESEFGQVDSDLIEYPEF